MGISDELFEKLKEWSEDNEYLYSLLCICWEKRIKTFACCCGHKEKPTPYIGIILDQYSLHYIESIIATLESIDNIIISCDYRYHSNKNLADGLSENERRAIVINCQMHNRCEVFFKLACAIEGIPKKILTETGKTFHKSILRFMSFSDEQIRECLNSGISVGYAMSTITYDYRKYSEYRKREALYGNALLQFFFKKIRDKNSQYQGKYEVQHEYGEYPTKYVK